jgi:hypothetical protein
MPASLCNIMRGNMLGGKPRSSDYSSVISKYNNYKGLTQRRCDDELLALRARQR